MIGAAATRRACRRLVTSVGVWARVCLFSALGAWGALSGCATDDAPARPRLVLLYAPCTVNRSFLSPYNPAVEYTPNLDRWGARSVVLERHQTEAGQSGTSYASLFSGAQTTHHGVFINGTIIRDSVELIGESLGRAGFEVFAWLNHGLGGTALQYDQGVPAENSTETFLAATTPRFLEILQRLRDDPTYRALIIANFTVTHGPYSTDHLAEFCGLYGDECGALADRQRFDADHELYRQRGNYRALSWDFPNAARRLGLSGPRLESFAANLELAYKANVYHLDRLFGEMVETIDEAGLLEQSLIAFTADHGEVLYRDNAHFQWTHGLQLAPEVLTVPALLLAPGLLESQRYGGVTRAIDLFPTIAALSGATAPTGPDFGRDLSAALRGETAPPDLLAFSHSTLVGPAEATPNDHYKLSMFHGEDPGFLWVGVRSGDRFYKRMSLDGLHFETRAFDLVTDPEERRDLFDNQDPADLRMEKLLERYKEALIRAYHDYRRTETPEETESRLEMLRALGYID